MAQKKITYHVHPERDHHVWITRLWTIKGKQEERIAFQVDCPGRWNMEDAGEKWNVHVDGCDHLCDSMREAVCKGISIDGCYFDPDKQAYADADFEVIHVAHDFDPYNRKKQAATL